MRCILSICLLALATFAPVFGQTPSRGLAQAEYFWDTDPGQGSGTAFTAKDGAFDEAIETLFQNGVATPAAAGPHTFNVRIKGADGAWSSVFTTVVELDGNAGEVVNGLRDMKVIQAEYFWDTDPGQGAATPILALDGALDEALETLFNNGVATPATAGAHTFNVRIKDVDNNWSLPFTTVVELTDNPNEVITALRDLKIVQAEYFWDTDPGQGSATPILALDGALDETLETLFDNGVPTPAMLGAHSFNLRIKDVDDNWSSLFTTVVFLQTDPTQVVNDLRDLEITMAEYFWDVDPGVGLGTPFVAFDGALDESLETLFDNGVTAPAAAGPHTFNVRVKDVDGNWSTNFTTVVDIVDNSGVVTNLRDMNVIQAEYFWDTDPGIGLGTSFVALDGALDETLETLFDNGVTAPAAAGAHTFNVRIKDVDGNWSTNFTTVVEIVDNSGVVTNLRDMNVIQAEYFWNADPGVGLGTSFVALDGALDETLETLFNNGVATPAAAGAHTFNVRIKDVDGNWSTTFTTVVELTDNTSIVTNLRDMKVTQAEYFWDTDPGEGSATPIVALDGALDETLETLFENGVVTPSTLGAHSFNLRIKDIDGNWSSVFTTVVFLQQDPTQVVNGLRDMKITMAEYYWDTDPGVGSGTPFVAFDGALDETLETLFDGGITAPAAAGAHTFNVRIKDVDGNWSTSFSTVVEVVDNTSVVTDLRDMKVIQAEYFWDTDPGIGSATPILALDGALDETLETMFANNLATPGTFGPHSFNLRIKDVDNNWSSLFTTVVDLGSDPNEVVTGRREMNVIQAEYFWDTDPGEGAATAIVALDGALDETLETLFDNGLTTPATLGAHSFNLRIKDVDGTWSSLFTTIVHVHADPTQVVNDLRDMKITMAEYFWNADPGEGLGTPFVAFDGALDETLETLFDNGVTAPAAAGAHAFNVRVRDVDGTWSSLFTTIVTVVDPNQTVTSLRDMKLVQGEYFWDTDPGQGAATPFVAADGAFDETLETLFDNGVVTPSTFGPHSFNVRVRDVDGNWSSLFRTIVYLGGAQQGQNPNPNDDNDGDGISELMEIFLGTDANQFDKYEDHFTTTFEPNGGGGDEFLTIEINRRAISAEVTLEVEISNDLNVWRGVADGWVEAIEETPTRLRFRATRSVVDEPNLFYRFQLKVN